MIKMIIRCLKEYLKDRKVGAVTERTNPINGLGMESMDGVAFACDLSSRLGWDIPGKHNPFVDDKRKRARDVGEMADFLIKLFEKENR